MNVLLLTLVDFKSIEERNLYTDLMREFIRNGHKVYIISPTEKRNGGITLLQDNGDHQILKLKTGNIQKTNIIEKGISTITIESNFITGIKNYLSDIKFDLILYSTPPITLCGVVEYLKQKYRAKTYLLLKDIFPQNAVDIGMLKESGISGLLLNYFRSREKKLYSLSDHIGCMSPANVDYILKNNPEIPAAKLEVCPNSIETMAIRSNTDNFIDLKVKYGIPLEKTVFIYGGNLGKPQGIDFLIECIKANEYRDESYFIIAGTGTELGRLKKFFKNMSPRNSKLLDMLPKSDYEKLVSISDVGMIFLDRRFTIPNFPSRLLDYMQASIPVLAATDVNTDLGEIVVNENFGRWCESDDIDAFQDKVIELCDPISRKIMGDNARRYLEDNYTVKNAYDIIIKHCDAIM